MKILVVGAGSIGRRHIGNLNKMGYKDIDVVEPERERRNFIRRAFKVGHLYENLEVALENTYDAAFILTPPVFHIPIALKFARKGMHFFIEKPLSHSMKNVKRLIRIVRKKRLTVMVGYNQRFNPGLLEIKRYLPRLGKIHYIRAEFGYYLPYWRPWQDYTESYTSRKSLGGGILLDASHEVDYVLWLVRKKERRLKAVVKRTGGLKIDVEDLAELLMEFEGGITASIHVNMMERNYNRKLKIIGGKGQLEYDFFKQEFIYCGNNNKTVKKSFKKSDSNQMYIDEIKHFLGCVRRRKTPSVTIRDGKKVLELVLKAKGSK